MSNALSRETRAIVSELQTTGRLLLTGAEALQQLRVAIAELADQAGLEIEFDPSTPADLKDFLVIGGAGALEGALKGMAVGLLLGSLFGNPRQGMLLGGSFGALVGAADGHQRVCAGWRLRAEWLPDGQPRALIEVR